MLTGTISSKGQVTIPKKIRELLKVGTFDKIVFIPIGNDRVIITNKDIPASELFGMLRHRKTGEKVSVKDMKAAVRKKRVERGAP